MKRSRLLIIGLSLALTMGIAGCTKKTETPKTETPKAETNVAMDEYGQLYSTNYNEYLMGLEPYNTYTNTENITKMYETKEYPGNEKYLGEVKAAYKDSRDKIQSFVDKLKSDTKTEDVEVKKMNENLIAEGEKTIKNIDARLAKLDTIPADMMGKTKEEFIKGVNETTKIEKETESQFNKMIKDMNNMFGIKSTTPKK